MAKEKAEKGEKKDLDGVLAELNKKYGVMTINRLADKPKVAVDVISTGSRSLNKAIGAGGFPKGRIIELWGLEASGKTLITLSAAAECQKEGGKVAFIDAEHAFNASFAKTLGVDVDNLIFCQPDYGEQGLDIVETLLENNVVDLIIVDSVAGLVPQKELEGEMGDSHIGVQARMMGQAMRKLTGPAAKSNTAVVFINQIREKIGVMFGCFHYNTRVWLANGKTIKIGTLVNSKVENEVLSFDPDTGKVVPRKVIAWHTNGNAEKFLNIEVEKAIGNSINPKGNYGKLIGNNNNGLSCMSVTPNHMIFTPTGEVPAGELKVGDDVLGVGMFSMNPMHRQVALGSILGDGSIRKSGRVTTQLRIKHGPTQKAYCQWKQELMGDLVGFSGEDKQGYGFDTHPSCDLTYIEKEAYYMDGKKRMRKVSDTWLKEMDMLGLAIWYMDDGHFSGSYEKWGKGKSTISVKSYSDTDIEKLADWFPTRGIPRPSIHKNKQLSWSGENCGIFQEAIAQYIHPSMDYKIHPNLRGFFKQPSMGATVHEHRMVPVKVLSISDMKPTKSMTKFDLTIEGGARYIVDGIGVHNSPNTTTGGNALKYYASLRLEVRRSSVLKQGDTVIGHRAAVKVVKNKVGQPHGEAQFNLYYANHDHPGIDMFGELVEEAIAKNIIDKAGAWYSFKGERLGQGEENTKNFIRSNEKVKSEILAALGA